MAKSGNKIAIAIVVAAIFVVGAMLYTSGKTPATAQQIFQVGGQQSVNEALGVCNNGQVTTTTATVDLKNGEDTTADSTFDATGYFFGSNGHYVTVTDTTQGTAALNCGETYTFKLVSADGNNGDNAKITGVESNNAQLNGDGSVTFTPTASAFYLKPVSSKHGVVEFRVFNVDNNGYRYKAGGASGAGNTNDWQLTGQTFNGTTSENSSITVGSGGRFTDEIHFRANQTDVDAADFGYWLFVDADTADWNEPTVKLDGAVLLNQKGSLTPDESRQFGSTYEYAYKIPGKLTDSEHVLRTEFVALSGVNPAAADSPTVLIAPIGAFKATASNQVLVGAAKDDSSATKVFTSQSLTLHIV